MNKKYSLDIAGLRRELPIIPIGHNLAIASFVLLGDAELASATAKELQGKITVDFDYILTAEAKGIPLAQELALLFGHKNYLVARKSVKAYMKDTLEVAVQSITTKAVQKLYLDGNDAAKLKGKRVLLVDDVISTGESLKALHELATKGGATISAQVAILAEGDAAKREDLIFLAELPLFHLSADGQVSQIEIHQ